ncbi:MAG: hypothetical protein WD824_01840 [Cyclobacteriaceae bacterium]
MIQAVKFDALQGKEGKNFHVLKGVFKGSLSLPVDVEKYLNELSLLVADEDMLYYSMESLKIIDLQIKDWSMQDVVEKLYAPLIIYTGEVIRRKVSGKWEIRKQMTKLESRIL